MSGKNKLPEWYKAPEHMWDRSSENVYDFPVLPTGEKFQSRRYYVACCSMPVFDGEHFHYDVPEQRFITHEELDDHETLGIQLKKGQLLVVTTYLLDSLSYSLGYKWVTSQVPSIEDMARITYTKNRLLFDPEESETQEGIIREFRELFSYSFEILEEML